MKINFDSATFQSLLQRANAEGKSIPKLVNELLTTVLTKEETNDKTEIANYILENSFSLNILNKRECFNL